MIHPENINIEEYDYPLPDERIARYPLANRDQSKLLVRRNGQLSQTTFQHISEYIPEGSLLVFNNTRVIQARLLFRKETGAQIEIFCLEPKQPADYAQSFSQTSACSWVCLIGNAKRWKSGKLQQRLPQLTLTAERIESYGETHLIAFEWDNPDYTFADVLEQLGELPIPPYLNRRTEENDKSTYQTVYSKIKGSVAAPTAGLHFTGEVLNALRAKGVAQEELTLHVGAGTFKPVKTETLSGHEMHTEYIAVRKETIEQLRSKAGQVFAVGTTSVRTLESLYYFGCLVHTQPDLAPDQLIVSQWDPYSEKRPALSSEEALNSLLNYMKRNNLDVLKAHTQILIAPGYSFHIVNGIVTNFHQPKSTLLLLISAFVGGDWKSIYDYALENDFRFLSYGDSSLLMKD